MTQPTQMSGEELAKALISMASVYKHFAPGLLEAARRLRAGEKLREALHSIVSRTPAYCECDYDTGYETGYEAATDLIRIALEPA